MKILLVDWKKRGLECSGLFQIYSERMHVCDKRLA